MYICFKMLMSIFVFLASNALFEGMAYSFTTTYLQGTPGGSNFEFLFRFRLDDELGNWSVDVDRNTEGAIIVKFDQVGRCDVTRNKRQIPITCPSPDIVCPSKRALLALQGYQKVDGLGYYKINRLATTWQGAKEACENEGSHLAIINSEYEALVLRSNVLAGDMVRFWVGVHDLYQEGTYVTIFNVTLEATGFNIWFPEEPNGGAAENCVAYAYTISTGSSGLADNPCDLHNPFICERATYKDEIEE